MNLMDHLGPLSQLMFFCDYFFENCGQKGAKWGVRYEELNFVPRESR